MSYTTVNAKIYISRIIGGAADPKVIDLAGEALLRGYEDWEGARFWEFLLKDTSLGFSVSGCTATGASTSVSAPSSGAFDGVNVGVTVTISSGTATLVAGTTVSSFTRNTDGTVASITLSNAFGGTTNVNATLAFSGNIPIIQGTNDYNLPTDFRSPYSAMLLTNKRTLTWRRHRHWDRVINDQTVQRMPTEYTTYNPYSEATQNYGATHLKFDGVPSLNDTLLLRYYRMFNKTGTNVDMPDQYVYKFLDYCRSLCLEMKRAQDDPASYRSSVLDAFQQAQEDDEEPTEDNDADMTMKSLYEMGENARPLWGNGDFDTYR